MRALHVAVDEQHLLARGRGELSGDEEPVRIAAAGEPHVERGDVLRQSERVLEADRERGEAFGMRKRDGHDAADVGGIDARERATRRREGEIEHALPFGGHAARGEARRLHDAFRFRASDEVSEKREVVGRARGHATEDGFDGEGVQFDHGVTGRRV